MPILNASNNKEFSTLAELKAITSLPRENDNVNVVGEGIARIYNYQPSNTNLENGNTVIALNNFGGRFIKIADGIDTINQLPTPKLYIPNNGFVNQNTGQDPNAILSIVTPANANKPITIKIYYEGNDDPQPWMNFPELTYELIRMKNSQKKARNAGGQKKAGGWQYVHPSHKDGADRAGSSYSSGSHTGVNGSTVAQRDTRWSVNTQSNKSSGKIVGNNPFTEIQIDPKVWFYDNARFGTASYGNDILPLRHIEYIDNNVRVSGYSRNNNTHGIQTFKFCFRMSCADPNSWNASKSRYDKRIYSDYSKEFEIYPHGGIFENGGAGNSGEFEKIYYEYRVRPI